MASHLNPDPSRRKFLRQASTAGLGTLLAGAAFSNLYCSTEEERKLGVALVGLGNYSTNKIAPAFEHAKHCYLAGIVTGTPEKATKWQSKYKLPAANVYNYENFDEIKNNKDIDIVYVVLPNSMHAEFSIRAAKAGKHVICEKPMAMNVAEAQQMIDTCEAEGRLLQIGYRNQYEPYTMELMRIGQKQELGKISVIETGNAFWGVGGKNWRFKEPKLSGGGPLMDMGVYCIQGARYTTGEEPVAVTAQAFNTRPSQFIGMEETIFFQLEFPSGAIANCSTSYAARADYLKVSAEKGRFGLEPAYGYSARQGYVNNESMQFEESSQQAVQMDAFARNILDGTKVKADGMEGLLDMKVIEAIYKAAETKGRVLV